LLKPDSSKAGGTGGRASMTHKQEKALEKKEKVRALPLKHLIIVRKQQ
jgi:hypothetical protein